MSARRTTDWPGEQDIEATPGDEAIGYRVKAEDGAKIGSVDHITYDRRWIVVRTGSRLFGGSRHIMLADAIKRVDPAEKEVVFNLSGREIEEAPEYDRDIGLDDDREREAEVYFGLVRLNRR
jgi:hypothetical protein